MFTFRSPDEPRIWPKKAFVITIEDGEEKIGVLVTLKAERRSWKYFLSVTRICLLREPSRRAMPGPRTIPTLALPKEKAVGTLYSFAPVGVVPLSSQNVPGPMWCGSLGVPFTLGRTEREPVPEGSPDTFA